jgi:hypothetical protein
MSIHKANFDAVCLCIIMSFSVYFICYFLPCISCAFYVGLHPVPYLVFWGGGTGLGACSLFDVCAASRRSLLQSGAKRRVLLS